MIAGLPFRRCAVSNSRSALNVYYRSADWRGHVLANFPAFPFMLDGTAMASVEGFVQGIKFPEHHESRAAAFSSWGEVAKHFGSDAERVSVWWNGSTIAYGSDEHHRLIARAIRAKFAFNEGARLALKATVGLVLKHEIGPESPTTSLPAAVFCRTLSELRDELLQTGTIKPPG
jgi:predicted NAD-dependent protein-ADP-ribosyltransferase YbiA (DUF1768 family)